MLIYKIRVKTYYFGTMHYTLNVLATSKDEALELVYKSRIYRNDEDASIDSVEVIDPSGGPRIL